MKCDICVGELKKIYQKIKKEESSLFYELKEYSGDGKDIFHDTEKYLQEFTPIFEKYIKSQWEVSISDSDYIPYKPIGNKGDLIITICNICRWFGEKKYVQRSVKEKSFLWIYYTAVLTIDKKSVS